jgi:hypothetical protein
VRTKCGDKADAASRFGIGVMVVLYSHHDEDLIFDVGIYREPQVTA